MCFIVIIAFSNFPACGQPVKKCDNSILKNVKGDGSSSEGTVEAFLFTLGRECQNNVEFNEWSNELLFTLLDKQTELTLKTIARNQNAIEMAVIMEDLNSPINDLIAVSVIKSKIEAVKFDRLLKRDILRQLQIALDKQSKP